MTLADFYNEYQTIILTNTGRNSDIIRWNNNTALTADEIIGPTTEDLILLDVIHLIDSWLPAYFKVFYQLKIDDRRLMDLKTDIFNNIKKFIEELNNAEQLNALRVQTAGISLAATAAGSPSLAALAIVSNRSRGRGRGRGSSTAQRWLLCKNCHDNTRGK